MKNVNLIAIILACAVGLGIGAVSKHYSDEIRNTRMEAFEETQMKIMDECKGVLTVTISSTNSMSQGLTVSCEVDKGE